MRIYVCLILLLLPFQNLLWAQALTIDNKQASVEFVFLEDDVDGTLSDFHFSGELDISRLETSVISGSVSSKSLDTDNWFRDGILKGRKYFNTREFPKITFKSTSITGTAMHFVAKGQLTIKGISHPVNFTFRKKANSLQGSSQIDASLWDINIYDGIDRNLVRITVTLPVAYN